MQDSISRVIGEHNISKAAIRRLENLGILLNAQNLYDLQKAEIVQNAFNKFTLAELEKRLS